ncbi:MAG: aldo/keto reductase [Sandaracinaceae bacterium]
MNTRTLGKTDLVLSEITLGTWGLAEQSYGKVEPTRLREVIDAALEIGVTTFDVAPLWGDGAAEQTLGDALNEAGTEDAVVITRGGRRRHEGEVVGDFREDALRRDCEASLERLGRDQVELFLLHNPSDDVILKEDWRGAVESLLDEGKIGAWGISVGGTEDARLAIHAGAQAICLPHNLASAHRIDDLLTELATANCGVLARSPLMYGLLAGQWSAMKRFEDEDHRSRRWGPDAFDARVRQIQKLEFLANGEHGDLATAALRYVLSNSLVTSALVGARTPAQIDHAVAAAERGAPYISDDDMARIAKLIG